MANPRELGIRISAEERAQINAELYEAQPLIESSFDMIEENFSYLYPEILEGTFRNPKDGRVWILPTLLKDESPDSLTGVGLFNPITAERTERFQLDFDLSRDVEYYYNVHHYDSERNSSHRESRLEMAINADRVLRDIFGIE